jgi:Uma2 family endonuclease
MPTAAMPLAPLVYPDSDGKPMAESTLQYRWIVTVRENIALQYADRTDVLVAADNLVYPVRANPRLCTAPDVYVAFGRPPGDRGSYKVWEEGDTFPQVIFEVLSPSNTAHEMQLKLNFYRRFGAEEYYVIDPDAETLEARVRTGGRFQRVRDTAGFVSPLLGIRFRWDDAGRLSVLRPDGTPFETFLDVQQARIAAEAKTLAALRMASDEAKRAEEEKKRAEEEKKRADHAQARADKLAAKLRELGLDPNGG